VFNRELLGVNPALAGAHSLPDIRVDVTALDRCVARATKDQWIDIRAGGKTRTRYHRNAIYHF